MYIYRDNIKCKVYEFKKDYHFSKKGELIFLTDNAYNNMLDNNIKLVLNDTTKKYIKRLSKEK